MQQFIPFNPYMTPQQRLNYMEQQYPQLAQQPMQQPMQQQNNQELITIPVTNVDEANAFRVNPNGTPTFFYNAGDDEIYLKKTNRETGKADFQIFKIQKQVQQQQHTVQTQENITTSNFEKELKMLNDKVDGLYSLFATVQTPTKSESVAEEIKISPAKGGRSVK